MWFRWNIYISTNNELSVSQEESLALGKVSQSQCIFHHHTFQYAQIQMFAIIAFEHKNEESHF